MDFFRKPSVSGSRGGSKDALDYLKKKYFLRFHTFNLFLLSEQLKTQNRDLRKTQREVERSQRDLERQEKQLEAEIKKAAKEGNKQVCVILAKNLVRLRANKNRSYTVNSQISAIGSKTKLMNAMQCNHRAMHTTTKTLKQVNAQANPAEMIKTLQEFSKQNQLMDMKEDLSKWFPSFLINYNQKKLFLIFITYTNFSSRRHAKLCSGRFRR